MNNNIEIELSPGGFLVVDDVSINLYITKEMLSEYGFPVDTASSGAEAVEKIRQGAEYDIIFMDHMMPEVNGVEATRAIREMGYNGCIVALTANNSGEYDDLYTQTGFNAILTKPIDQFELDDIIDEFTDPGAGTEQAGGASGIFVTFDNDDDDLTGLFLMDADSAMETLGKLLASPDGVTENDLNLYEITVHGVKSALRNIGQADLAENAYNLELAAKAGDIARINRETSGFLQQLKEYAAELR